MLSVAESCGMRRAHGLPERTARPTASGSWVGLWERLGAWFPFAHSEHSLQESPGGVKGETRISNLVSCISYLGDGVLAGSVVGGFAAATLLVLPPAAAGAWGIPGDAGLRGDGLYGYGNRRHRLTRRRSGRLCRQAQRLQGDERRRAASAVGAVGGEICQSGSRLTKKELYCIFS